MEGKESGAVHKGGRVSALLCFSTSVFFRHLKLIFRVFPHPAKYFDNVFSKLEVIFRAGLYFKKDSVIELFSTAKTKGKR